MLRILLVGDPEVGKSSIISTYTSRHFPDDGVPSIIYDSKLPPDSTANGTFVVIMDSNARNGNNKSNSTLTDKILMADSIVCVYDVTRPETLESIANEWLPLIKDVISSANNQNNQFNGVYGTGGITGMNNSNNSNSFYLSSGGVDSSELSYGLNSTNSNNNNNNNSTRPMPSVIVAGNKTDLLNDRSEDLRAEEESELKYFSSLLSEFSFVKYCCRCSAKMLDVDSVFYYAENVITFPIDPLYDVLTSDFTAQAVGAFKRIFRLFDDDCDGYLSDAEIATLQLRCFQIEFANDEILALKKHIIKDVPGGLVRNKITFTGFLGMIRKFIEKRSNLETAWIILRRCGYANSSSLTLEMPPDIECLPPSSSFADACTVDEVSTWKRLVDRLKIPLALTVSGSAPRVPVLECMNDYAATAPNHDVLYSSEMRHQLSILQEQQQYSATGLCREAVQFLVSLCLVTEENTRRRYRREVDAATGIATRTSSASASGAGSDAGSNISDPAGAEVEADLSSSSSRGQTPIFQFPDSVQLDPRTQLLTNVLNQLTWNELSQESIEEIFSVLPRSSCVFPREPTNNAIGVAGSGVGTGTNDIPVSHPWNSPPLFTPSQQEVNTSSTSASTSPVLSLYCFNGYYSYSLTPVASVPTAAPAPPVSGSLTVDVSGGGESASTESIAGSPKESDLSALNAGTAAADTDDTDTDTDMDKDLLKKAPVKANNSTHGGLLYTTISMWIAHWQLLAMYEPTLVQVSCWCAP